MNVHPHQPLHVRCPHCKAIRGERCRKSPGLLSNPHVARHREVVRVYLEQAREQAREDREERDKAWLRENAG